MSKNFIDRFYEEDNNECFWSLNKKICAGMLVLFLAVIMVSGCTQLGNNNSAVEEIEVDLPLEQDTVKVGNDGVNAAIAPDDTSAVDNNLIIKKIGSTIAMSVENIGRSDPFLPENEIVVVKKKTKPTFTNYLLPPPEMISVDTTATDVMTTKVSGIMYDKDNPSAILNIGGTDYLVRTGDIINGYKVLSIGKDIVTVQNGANVYKASVGELFTGDGINFNTVSNLETKFGSTNNK